MRNARSLHSAPPLMSGQRMVQLSSEMTRVVKGWWAVWVCVAASAVGLGGLAYSCRDPLLVLVVTGLLAAFLTLAVHQHVTFNLPLADLVLDGGDELIVERNGVEHRIPLVLCERVVCQRLRRYPRVSVFFRERTALGWKLDFLAPSPYLSFGVPDIVSDLNDRITEIRSAPSA